MAMIYMFHPIHGRKIASIEAEAEFDEKHGWTRYNPEAPEPEPPVNALKRKYTRKAETEEV
tara:strand:- start:307 stop:489 length:183 start_codon:yes stop_codon:yes gene_type:complete